MTTLQIILLSILSNEAVGEVPGASDMLKVIAEREDILEVELQDALEREDYAKAIELRDKMKER